MTRKSLYLYCPNCGRDINTKHVSFCPYCGVELYKEEIPSTVPENTAPEASPEVAPSTTEPAPEQTVPVVAAPVETEAPQPEKKSEDFYYDATTKGGNTMDNNVIPDSKPEQKPENSAPSAGGSPIKTKFWPIVPIALAVLALIVIFPLTAAMIGIWSIIAAIGLLGIIAGLIVAMIPGIVKPSAARLVTGISSMVLVLALVLGFGLWFIRNYELTPPATTQSTATQQTQQQQQQVQPTAPAATTKVPVIPTTPGIYAAKDGVTYQNQGEYLDTELGKRITFTCRKVVVPNKAYNAKLTSDELKLIETTWLNVKLDVPNGTTAVIFAGGLEQGLNRYENGVLLSVGPGHYELNLRNGEIVLWYPNQDAYKDKDFNRIVTQIRNGNFDIEKGELALTNASSDLLSKLPTDLVQKHKITAVDTLVAN